MKVYNYECLKNDMERLGKEFSGMEWGSIGQSLWGRELFYIRLGRGENVISYNGAHHGMEWLTSAMLMQFAEEYLQHQRNGTPFCGFNTKVLDGKTSLYIIPMVNPDGVDLATGGIPSHLDERFREILTGINPEGDFRRWQGNGRGVDLNHNYDALWEQSKAMEKEYGVWGAGATRYSGDAPLSEPESRALVEFTRKMDFALTIAFHSQGKVIYHGFNGKTPPLSEKIVRAFECISPYKEDNAVGIASCGGYKDWFVDKFNRPGFTVEVGEGENPLPIENLPIIYKETLPIMLGTMQL